ncbi:MAG TPA: signal peptidase II [Candidatus Scybalocola faecipullorum]|nr:signal peptidase II [Candidatus Scybalocola faecipullorum]
MKYIKAIVSIIVLTAIDQITKFLAVRYLMEGGPIVLIDGVFELRYLENRGSAFGLMQNQRIFFIIITIIIVGIFVWLYCKLPDTRRMRWMHLICIGIISGALGNFIDRFINGYVVDFFYFKLINFPIFNVADIYVTVSAAVLIVLGVFYYKEDDYKFLTVRKNKSDAGKEEE